MKAIIKDIQESRHLEALTSEIGTSSRQLLTGLSGSAKAMAGAALLEKTKRPLLVVASNSLQAQNIHADLSELLPKEALYYFPADEFIHFEQAVASPEIQMERVAALDFLISGQAGVVVTPLAGIKRFLPPVESFQAAHLSLAVGDDIDLAQLNQHLVDMGYQREKRVAAPGEFSLRGGIVDIYMFHEDRPIRMELFDTEVDSIRSFDVKSQRSIDKMDTITISPARANFYTKAWKEAAADKIEKEIARTETDSWGQEALETFEAEMGGLLEGLREDEPYPRLDAYAGWIYPEQSSLLDYLPTEGVLIFDDYPRVLEAEVQMAEGEAHYKEDQASLLLNGLPLSIPLDDLKGRQVNVIYQSLFKRGVGNVHLDQLVDWPNRNMQQFFGQMSLLQAEVQRWAKQSYRVVILLSQTSKVKELQELLDQYDIEARVEGEVLLPPGQVQIMEGTLRNGFEWPDERLAIITERELFNTPPKRRPRRANITSAEKISSYNELELGDYVVHYNHGIGRYLGIETMEIDGTHKDYMQIEYQQGAKVYVPVDQFDLVQKYTASEGVTPKIHKLGGTDWEKTKRKVSNQVEDIAEDLIEIYATRESREGHAYAPDNDLQRAFEDAFPYTETPDQLQATAEIKRDLESRQPMDRLLVGDVGYGKTEVAMRAIFKVVQEGKQAAYLAPTTVLVQQQFDALRDRFSEFAVKVDYLSRFKTPKQQEETLERLKSGKIDVIVGTHRLLSDDVEYKDLGLLVVDEEQRFGVKHKEKIKKLKADVDVLTLTATPIPRTLNLSMMGVRDLSVIETPPQDRLPIQTFVMENNWGAVKEAIERELARGGQVYYLHNRVRTMPSRVHQLEELVPDARIAYINGQMAESRLEETLLAFVNQEIDVLVTTTIIETGVDVPNANTLIVEDADRMGLSQLYQIRGRVGRSSRVAYAYLMYSPEKILKEESVERLQALREFTALGSGFKIALRDLSIRGAGNVLGQEQSGFIDSVGYDMYTKMLREAVARRQGRAPEERTDMELSLDIDAYIPDTYIEDETQKIEMYQEIQAMDAPEDYLQVQDDFIDRFGDYPQEVSDLLSVGLLKMYGERALIEKIDQRETRLGHDLHVIFSLRGSKSLPGDQIIEALENIDEKVEIKRVSDRIHVIFHIKKKTPVNVWLDELIEFARRIADYRKEKADDS